MLHKTNGWLEIICGCMFSGKTEELMKRIRQAEQNHLLVKVFKPAIDVRFSNHSIMSHNGSSVAAISVKNAQELLNCVPKDIDMIGIDEAQFFDEDIVSVVNMLADQGVRVIVAGLDTNFRGDPFGPMSSLMATSDSITKLHAICTICHSTATCTQRIMNGKPVSYDAPVILIGAEESYEARCRFHHEVPNKPSLL